MKFDKLTKKELLDLAAQKNVAGRSKMTKEELVSALEPLFMKTSAVSKAKPGTKKTATTKGKKVKGKSASGDDEAENSELIGYEVNPPKGAPRQPKKDEYPIPPFYNADTLVLMPVDPSREYIYWEICDNTLNKFKSELRLSETRLMLKMFSRLNNNVVETASVPVDRMGNWFFNIYAPETVVWSELGIIDSNGAFHRILKSRMLKMPADKVSDIVDKETWLTVGGDLEKLYQLSGVGMRDYNTSKTIKHEMAKQISQHLGSSNTGSSVNNLKDK